MKCDLTEQDREALSKTEDGPVRGGTATAPPSAAETPAIGSDRCAPSASLNRHRTPADIDFRRSAGSHRYRRGAVATPRRSATMPGPQPFRAKNSRLRR